MEPSERRNHRIKINIDIEENNRSQCVEEMC